MREDDGKSGVGAQRGGGLHREWVKALDRGGEEEQVEEGGGSDSTTSSLFEEYFPKRYFILKAHNNEDLDESARQGTWRTQTHNEPVLDQAHRTAHEGVFIIFSANKSGEWYGYAKMGGPINPGEQQPGDASPPPCRAQTLSVQAAEALERDRQAATETLGKPFPVEWICVKRLAFSRTRHITNSFNAGREVKISRDGTEVEPAAGAQLLEEFWQEQNGGNSRASPGVNSGSGGTWRGGARGGGGGA